MQIITNNVPRDVIGAHELTRDEQADFPYVPWSRLDIGEETHPGFFRYKGTLYDLGDCEYMVSPNSPLISWDGYYSDSYFSGIIVRYAPGTDFEQVIVGTYLA